MAGPGRLGISVVAVAALAMSACGGDDTTTPPRAAGTTSVAVTLQEWAVLPAQASAPAGSVTFEVQNKGPKYKHEFVVFKTDLDPSALPTKADGSVDESGAGVQTMGEIEEFAFGTTQSKTFTVSTGKYVLFCNVLETEAIPDVPDIKAHYKLGMRTAFSVT